ncbi:MAG: hypothetical protein ABI615_11645 [Chthoniobacterales bacterium]
MKKVDLVVTFLLLILTVLGICTIFSGSIRVSGKTILLLALLFIYIPVYIGAAANAVGTKNRRARIFLYGGFLLLILATAVWHTFALDITSGVATSMQIEALRYYQQVIILLCSAIGGSSIFHGIRLFNENRNE